MGRLHRALNHRAVRLAGPILGLACSAVFISRLDFHEVGSAFGSLALVWMVPVLVFGCVNLWLRAVRWGVLLAPAAPLPTAQLLGVGISAALAGLEPAGARRRRRQGVAGDPPARRQADRRRGGRAAGAAGGRPDLRRLHLGRGAGRRRGRLAARPSGWAPSPSTCRPCSPSRSQAGTSARVPPSAEPTGPAWHPRRLLDHAVGAAHRRGPRLLVRATQLSVLAWAAEAVSYYCLLVAFGWLAPPTLPFAAVGVANFAFAVPGRPAGVGTFHVPVSSLLVDSFGAEPGLAAAYAVVLHLAVLAPVPIVWVLLAARRRWQAVTVRTVHVRSVHVDAVSPNRPDSARQTARSPRASSGARRPPRTRSRATTRTTTGGPPSRPGRCRTGPASPATTSIATTTTSRCSPSLGRPAHRLSLEWSRIEPRPGELSHEALDHYRRVLESLRGARHRADRHAPPLLQPDLAGRARRLDPPRGRRAVRALRQARRPRVPRSGPLLGHPQRAGRLRLAGLDHGRLAPAPARRHARRVHGPAQHGAGARAGVPRHEGRAAGRARSASRTTGGCSTRPIRGGAATA